MSFTEPDGATPLDPAERRGLKFPHITTRVKLDEPEQSNIEDGLRWISRRRGGDIFDAAFLRRMHRRLFGEVWQWAGGYRLTEKNIGIAPSQISMLLRMLRDGARFRAKNKVSSPLAAAAVFHHRLVQINPFPNGNGRHARITTDMMLEDYYDHPPVEWANGFDFHADNHRRKQCIAALRAADAHDFDPLLIFVGAAAPTPSTEPPQIWQADKIADHRLLSW